MIKAVLNLWKDPLRGTTDQAVIVRNCQIHYQMNCQIRYKLSVKKGNTEYLWGFQRIGKDSPQLQVLRVVMYRFIQRIESANELGIQRIGHPTNWASA